MSYMRWHHDFIFEMLCYSMAFSVLDIGYNSPAHISLQVRYVDHVGPCEELGYVEILRADVETILSKFDQIEEQNYLMADICAYRMGMIVRELKDAGEEVIWFVEATNTLRARVQAYEIGREIELSEAKVNNKKRRM